MPTTQPRKFYTVSQLNSEIKSLIEENFPFVWIVGEISNFHVPASGHFYFTLKDSKSQIQSVMFQGQNRRLKFYPEDGMSVMGMGRISLYEPRGSYQIILEYLEPKGIGALQLAFDQLKEKLQAQGLFDEDHKQDLPYLPQYICLITSPTGSVVHDIIKILNRRFKGLSISIMPVQVQGDRAIHEIVAAIDRLNEMDDVDLAILARGGGSLEDLQAFNSESVARAVHGSGKPIISAIGHETDYTIVDFVADYRAPTPSAAAEIAVPNKQDLKNRLDELTLDLSQAITFFVKQNRTRQENLTQRLVDPNKRIQDLRLKTDELYQRLESTLNRYLQMSRERLSWKQDKLLLNNPIKYVSNIKVELEHLRQSLGTRMDTCLYHCRSKLRELNGRMTALSPLAILNRGYSITRTLPELDVVQDTVQVSRNQDLEITLAKGKLKCRVKEKLEDAEKNI